MEDRDYLDVKSHTDPTADAVIRAWQEKYPTPSMGRVFMPTTYICSKWDDRDKVLAYCRYAMDMGCIPVSPVLAFGQLLDPESTEELGQMCFFGKVLLSGCRQVWVFGEPDKEMKAEIYKANDRRIPVTYYTETCKEVAFHA